MKQGVINRRVRVGWEKNVPAVTHEVRACPHPTWNGTQRVQGLPSALTEGVELLAARGPWEVTAHAERLQDEVRGWGQLGLGGGEG